MRARPVASLLGRPASAYGDYVRGRGPRPWPTPPPEGARVGYAPSCSSCFWTAMTRASRLAGSSSIDWCSIIFITCSLQ
jgi:hypothetical protein